MELLDILTAAAPLWGPAAAIAVVSPAAAAADVVAEARQL